MPYPDELDTFTDPVAGQPLNAPSQSGITQKIHDSLVAVQTALGLNPKGAEADLVTRVTNGLGFRDVKRYETSGTFNKADYPWLRLVRVIVIGAGGGSGATTATAVDQVSYSSGGGGGGYVEGLIKVADLAASETVTVGAKGIGATAAGANGTDGGASSFGTHLTGEGGIGGAGRGVFASASAANGTLGGSASFDVNTVKQILRSQGGPGGGGFGIVISGGIPVAVGGQGGASFLGGGARERGAQGSQANAGISPAAAEWGSGGGGAAAGESNALQVGADGANGLVVIELYG